VRRKNAATAGLDSDGGREALGETKEAPSTKIAAHTQVELTGWPLALISEIAAAPDRRVAANLLALSVDAIAALPDTRRELLLATLQDTIRELPFRT